MDPTRLVAHRGWQNRYPENTLPAIAAAIAAGARNIEIDIQLSGDGVAMLFHDARMERLCQRHDSVFDHSAAELQGIVVFEPERFSRQQFDTTVCTLAQAVELIAEHPQINLYVELKKQSIARFGRSSVLDAVEQALAPIKHQAILISFDFGILRLARRRGWKRVGPILTLWRNIRSKTVAALEPDCIFTNTQLIPKRSRLQKLRYRLVVYEVGSEDEASYWLERGVHQVETFRIGELLGVGADGRAVAVDGSDSSASGGHDH